MLEVGGFYNRSFNLTPFNSILVQGPIHKFSIPDNLALCVSLPILCFYTPPLCSFLLSLLLPKFYLSIVLSESEV